MGTAASKLKMGIKGLKEGPYKLLKNQPIKNWADFKNKMSIMNNAGK